VPYWKIVTRSFAISWRHRYLWLLALFAGESGGSSFSFSQSQSIQPGVNRNAPDFNGAAQQVSSWVAQNLGVILVVSGLLIFLFIAFFVLAALCEGALVRASAEHDAERPFDLAVAWRCGVVTMGTIIRFRLLLLLLGLPVFIVLVVLVIGAVAAFVGHNTGAGVAFVLVGLLLLLAAIPYSIYLSFLNRLGARAAVLEQLAARPAIVRAHRLLSKRLGRVLLVWLLSIAVGIVVAIGVTVVLASIAIPLFIAGVAAYASGSGAFWVVILLGVLILLPVGLIVGSFFSAQDSTYWTLAFRRLEIDQAAPAPYGYQTPPQAAPPQSAS
jgi:hypothetical protein